MPTVPPGRCFIVVITILFWPPSPPRPPVILPGTAFLIGLIFSAVGLRQGGHHG
jgi:hypothetical protein